MNIAHRGWLAAAAAAGFLLLGACTDNGPADPFPNSGTPVAVTASVTPAVTVDPDEPPAAPLESTPEEQGGDGETPASPPPVDPPVEQVTISADEEYRITAAGTVSVLCEGPGDLKVDAAAVVTVTGECDDVEVNASDATVTLEAADDLKIDGDGNTVSAGSVRSLDIEGDDNVVEADQISSEIDISGDRNTVSFSAGQPEVDDEGTGNTVN